jgi:hypothetical protein
MAVDMFLKADFGLINCYPLIRITGDIHRKVCGIFVRQYQGRSSKKIRENFLEVRNGAAFSPHFCPADRREAPFSSNDF